MQILTKEQILIAATEAKEKTDLSVYSIPPKVLKWLSDPLPNTPIERDELLADPNFIKGSSQITFFAALFAD